MKYIPARLKIGPLTYEVLIVPEHELRGVVPDKDLVGEISYNHGIIRVSSALCKQAQEQTLWHEILHGIMQNAGKSDHSEEIIDLLATGIMGVLNDNPQLTNDKKGS